MIPVVVEGAIARVLKQVFDEAKLAREQALHVDSSIWSDQSENAVYFSNACESLAVILGELETLRILLAAMIGEEIDNENKE